jgi:hypothetical protein
MNLSKKNIVGIALIAYASYSFASQEPLFAPNNAPQASPLIKEDVASNISQAPSLQISSQTAYFLHKAGDMYDTYSKKIEFACNPIGLASTAVVSAALGMKRFIIVAAGTAVLLNASEIKASIEHNLKEHKKRE